MPKKINWDKYKNDKNTVILDLIRYNYFDDDNDNEDKNEDINKNKQQIKIPSGIFPNLIDLKVHNKYITGLNDYEIGLFIDKYKPGYKTISKDEDDIQETKVIKIF